MKWTQVFLFSLMVFSNVPDSEDDEGHFSPQPGGKIIKPLSKLGSVDFQVLLS